MIFRELKSNSLNGAKNYDIRKDEVLPPLGSWWVGSDKGSKANMSRYGLEIARKYGAKLPGFQCSEDANIYWSRYRSDHLTLLDHISEYSNSFSPDYCPDSLKTLEKWYFDLYENDSFKLFNIDRSTFESCMAMYLGEVIVRNTEADWIVEAFAFVSGKYELGVRKGTYTVMLWRLSDHYQTPNNKRMQSTYRGYKKFAD